MKATKIIRAVPATVPVVTPITVPVVAVATKPITDSPPRVPLKLCGLKRCHKCDHDKPLSEFYRCAGRIDGVQSYCKECWRVYSRPSKRRWERAHIRSATSDGRRPYRLREAS